jgi:hypothetical protein
VAARSKGRSTVARLLRSWVQIPPGALNFVCCECCVLSSRGLCDELITRQEESYRLCCVIVCDLETTKILVNEEEAKAHCGALAPREKRDVNEFKSSYRTTYINWGSPVQKYTKLSANAKTTYFVRTPNAMSIVQDLYNSHAPKGRTKASVRLVPLISILSGFWGFWSLR